MSAIPTEKPGSSRKRVALPKYDGAIFSRKKSKNDSAWTTLAFYQRDEAVMINDRIIAVYEWDDEKQCEMYFLRRENHVVKDASHVRFSRFQGRKLATWLTQILDEVDAARKESQKKIESGAEDDDELWIPSLKGKEELKFSWKCEEGLGVWANPDFDVGTIRAIVLMNQCSGIPEVLLNSTVSQAQSEAHSNWQGPVFRLQLSDVERLESFILEMRNKTVRPNSLFGKE